MASVVSAVEAEYQATWDYFADKPRGIVGPVEVTCIEQGELGLGDVLICEAQPLEEREYWPDPFPIVILMTGDDGSRSYRPDYGLLDSYQAVGGGNLCRDLMTSERFSADYFSVVAYWFLEGQPDRMDADRDGIPCETVFGLWDIAGFWDGTPSEEATNIHFGFVTDVGESGSGYELTIDYAFFLGGMEANLAAEAAGEIAPGEGVPNDYFIQNENPRLRTFPLAPDVEVSLVDLNADLGHRLLDPAQWAALIAEARRCEAAGWPSECAGLGSDDWTWYGGGYLPYWIQLDGETVVRVEEQYLP